MRSSKGFVTVWNPESQFAATHKIVPPNLSHSVANNNETNISWTMHPLEYHRVKLIQDQFAVHILPIF